jgi:hypothetical protein
VAPNLTKAAAGPNLYRLPANHSYSNLLGLHVGRQIQELKDIDQPPSGEKPAVKTFVGFPEPTGRLTVTRALLYMGSVGIKEEELTTVNGEDDGFDYDDDTQLKIKPAPDPGPKP